MNTPQPPTPSPQSLKLLICDDQDIVRQGLNIIFQYQDDIDVVGLASNGKEAVEIALAKKPDVVLMDLKMPVLNGIHATRQIREQLPETQVVVLTTYDADEWVFDAIRAGAGGYLLKDASGEMIISAVIDAHAGKHHLDPQIAGKILGEFTRQPRKPIQPKANEPVLARLTEREQSILDLMVQGKTNQEIADALFLASGTIKNNVSNILGKLHANDRTQAVLTALRRGIVEL